jgi:translation initiation factor IF-3
MEWSKYNYEQEKAAKEAKRKQRDAVIETKELKLRPATDVHDYQVRPACMSSAETPACPL